MKKTILVLIIVFISLAGNAQNAIVEYSDVVQIEGVPKDQLYNRARIWLANTYNNSKYVIQMEDKEMGQIIGKASMSFSPSKMMQAKATGYIDYTIKIAVKNGRYKWEMTDFIHNGLEYDLGLITSSEVGTKFSGVQQKWSNNVLVKIKETIEHKVPSIILSLETGMNTEAEIENDDW